MPALAKAHNVPTAIMILSSQSEYLNKAVKDTFASGFSMDTIFLTPGKLNGNLRAILGLDQVTQLKSIYFFSIWRGYFGGGPPAPGGPSGGPGGAPAAAGSSVGASGGVLVSGGSLDGSL